MSAAAAASHPLGSSGLPMGSEQVTPDMEMVLLNKLAEVAQQLSLSSQQQAVNGERVAGLLDRMDTNLERAETERIEQHSETRSHMDNVARDMKAEIKADALERDYWWRKLLVVIAVAEFIRTGFVVGEALFKK